MKIAKSELLRELSSTLSSQSKPDPELVTLLQKSACPDVTSLPSLSKGEFRSSTGSVLKPIALPISPDFEGTRNKPLCEDPDVLADLVPVETLLPLSDFLVSAPAAEVDRILPSLVSHLHSLPKTHQLPQRNPQSAVNALVLSLSKIAQQHPSFLPEISTPVFSLLRTALEYTLALPEDTLTDNEEHVLLAVLLAAARLPTGQALPVSARDAIQLLNKAAVCVTQTGLAAVRQSAFGAGHIREDTILLLIAKLIENDQNVQLNSASAWRGIVRDAGLVSQFESPHAEAHREDSFRDPHETLDPNDSFTTAADDSESSPPSDKEAKEVDYSSVPAIKDMLLRLAQDRIAAALQLALSADVERAEEAEGVRGLEHVEEVFDSAAVAVRLLCCGITTATKHARCARVTQKALQLLEACSSSEWQAEPACIDMCNMVMKDVVLVVCLHPAYLAAEVLARLRQVLCSYAVLAQETASKKVESLESEMCRSICAMAASLWAAHETAIVTSYVYSLGAALATDMAPYISPVEQSSVARLLGLLCVTIEDEKVTSVALPLLMDALAAGYGSLNVGTMYQIGTAQSWVACLSEAAYQEVLTLLTRLYSDPYTNARKNPSLNTDIAVLPQIMLNLAQHLASPDLQKDMFRRLLTLFSEVGLLAHQELAMSSSSDVASVGNFLGLLLPPIAHLASYMPPPTTYTSTDTVYKLLRNVWFYCTVLQIAPTMARAVTGNRADGQRAPAYPWPKEWACALEIIAAATPPLVANTEHEGEETVLELSTMLEGLPQPLLEALRTRLLTYLQGDLVMGSTISSFSSGQMAGLLASFHLEGMRAAAGPIVAPLHYLQMDRTSSSIDQSSALVKVYARMMKLGCDLRRHYLSSFAAKEAQAAAVVADVCALLDFLVGSTAVSRKTTMLVLQEAIAQFPSALFSQQCLATLFQSMRRVEVLSERMAADHSKDSVLNCVSRIQRQWLNNISTNAPVSAKSLLEAHVQPVYTPGAAPPAYLGNILRVLVQIKEPPALGSFYEASESGTLKYSSELAALSLKSHFAGQVEAMDMILPYLGCSLDAEDERSLGRAVVRSMAACVSDDRGPEGSPQAPIPEGNSLELALLRCAGLLCGQRSPDAFLVGLLCWGPAHTLTRTALRAAAFSWSWLLATKPDLSLPLLEQQVAAFVWTKKERLGIFAPTVVHPKLCPMMVAQEPVSRAGSLYRRSSTQPAHAASSSKAVHQNILAHATWIAYLYDRWQVLKTEQTHDAVQLMLRLLSEALEDPFGLSGSPAAVKAVFRLLLLALQVLKDTAGELLRPEEAWCQVRDKAHAAALWWFAAPPGWLHDSIPEELEDTAAVLEKLVAALESSKLVGLQPAQGGRSDLQLDHERQLLQVLCWHEADRLRLWAKPLSVSSSEEKRKQSDTASYKRCTEGAWKQHVQAAWRVAPRIAIALAKRFPDVECLRPLLTAYVSKHAHLPAVQRIPEAVSLLVTAESVERNAGHLQHLTRWAAACITDVVSLLRPEFAQHPLVSAYAARALDAQPEQDVIFFLPQLVQALRLDPGGQVEEYLMNAAAREPLFAHNLIWVLGGEEAPPKDMEDMVKRSGWINPWDTPNALWPIVDRVRDRIKAQMRGRDLEFFEAESKLFDAVTQISGILKPIPPADRRAAIAAELEKIPVTRPDLYLPTSTTSLVRSIKTDSGRPLQSAAKVPIMVTFEVTREEDRSKAVPQACIFKVGDDCRQDVLALQIISLLRDVWAAAELELYVFPYGVLPTAYECGIIEVVPNSYSRNELGHTSDGGMLDMFGQLFGRVGTERFEAARQNFIVSCAGYAVASFLLNSKDRHNGNLLIDKTGHLVHIDFGFIFEISPGGNLGFETAAFKLSHEMAQLLDPGGTKNSPQFLRFMELTIQGYLAARQHMDAFLSVVRLMLDSGLPCFSRGTDRVMRNLKKRFHPELSNQEAAVFMRKTILDAYDKWTTGCYDIIQYLQQGITH